MSNSTMSSHPTFPLTQVLFLLFTTLKCCAEYEVPRLYLLMIFDCVAKKPVDFA